MNNLLNRTICPNKLLLSTKDIDLKKLEPSEKIILDNNIEVAVFSSSSTEIIKLDFIFEAGTYFQKKVFEASFTNYLLTEGTTKKSAKEIADYLDFRGAYIEKNIEKETACITAYFLDKYSEDIVPLLHEVIYESAFSESEFNIYKEKRKQQFLVNLQKVNFVAQTRFSEMIFGKNHPYGIVGEYDDFNKLDIEDLKSFHAVFYKNRPFQCIVSGSVNSKLLSLLNTYFGTKNDFSLPTEKIQYKIKNHTSEKLFIPVTNAVQTAIRIGGVNINNQHPDYPMLMILNTLLGGYFGSRLMKNIREEKGYTYGIYSVVHSFKESGLFFITTEVDANVTELAVAEILHEVNRLHKEKITVEELALVKNYLIGEFVRNMDGIFELSERYKSLLLLSQTNKYYHNYIDAIEKATPNSLQIIAEKYLHEDTMSCIYVGKQ